MSGFLTNGLPMLGQIGPQMNINVDTMLPRGTNPQSVAASVFQVVAVLGECLLNHSTSNEVQPHHHDTEMDTFGGIVDIAALDTAPMEEFVFELRNALIDDRYLARGMIPEVGLYSGTNTGGRIPGLMTALMILQSTTPVPGRVTWVFKNMGNEPLNGSMNLLWHL